MAFSATLIDSWDEHDYVMFKQPVCLIDILSYVDTSQPDTHRVLSALTKKLNQAQQIDFDQKFNAKYIIKSLESLRPHYISSKGKPDLPFYAFRQMYVWSWHPSHLVELTRRMNPIKTKLVLNKVLSKSKVKAKSRSKRRRLRKKRSNTCLDLKEDHDVNADEDVYADEEVYESDFDPFDAETETQMPSQSEWIDV
jgi:hypothetical protein